MKLSPILNPQGLPMWSAGGHSWKTKVHRGFVCSLEWIGEGKKSQPAMVIWPASNVFASREGAPFAEHSDHRNACCSCQRAGAS